MSLLFAHKICTVRMTEHWHLSKDGDPVGMELYLRHYSAAKRSKNSNLQQAVGPGEKLVLLTEQGDAIFAWRKFIDDAIPKQEGVNCAIFRNESQLLSSMLILEAERVAQCRWRGERMYTYVNPGAIRSTNPGACFLAAGWQKCGRTKGGLQILEKVPCA